MNTYSMNYTLERDNRELQLSSSNIAAKVDYTLERDNRELQRLHRILPGLLDYTLERDNRELQPVMYSKAEYSRLYP